MCYEVFTALGLPCLPGSISLISLSSAAHSGTATLPLPRSLSVCFCLFHSSCSSRLSPSKPFLPVKEVSCVFALFHVMCKICSLPRLLSLWSAACLRPGVFHFQCLSSCIVPFALSAPPPPVTVHCPPSYLRSLFSSGYFCLFGSLCFPSTCFRLLLLHGAC